MLVSKRTEPVHCRGQELTVGVQRECTRSAVAAQLTIRLVPYGTDTTSKEPLPMGDLDPI